MSERTKKINIDNTRKVYPIITIETGLCFYCNTHIDRNELNPVYFVQIVNGNASSLTKQNKLICNSCSEKRENVNENK